MDTTDYNMWKKYITIEIIDKIPQRIINKYKLHRKCAEIYYNINKE